MLRLLLFTLTCVTVYGSRNCYKCASTELQSRWFLTGLPKAGDIFGDCLSLGSSTPVESCDGPCVTLMFDDPDQVAGFTPLIVRGCQATLMQIQSDRGSNSEKFCEIDNSYKIANSKGVTVEIKMLAEFCSGDSNRCNDRKNYENCSSGKEGNNQLISCYDCNAKQGKNCKDGKCNKKYCMKQKAKLGGGYQIIKTCSNVNIFGVDNYCSSEDVLLTPGGITFQTRYQQCFCKDKQFCNSSTYSSFFLSSILLIISLFMKE
ncbi:unnamed protein product [Auanema sp. JU1783]|nr:unnamed protein product [Auanema sp. JU1783]